MRHNIFLVGAIIVVIALTTLHTLEGSLNPHQNLPSSNNLACFSSEITLSPLEKTNTDTTPPTIEIVNPTEGYFHFSGIKLFSTQLDIVADTMGFGGFRVRPVQVRVTDNVDSPQDISVYMYVYENEQGQMNYNTDNNLHERKWIGPDLGAFTLNITAEDTSNNTESYNMEVWYFCFIPEA
jgi:hypothetical protein